MTAPGGKEVFLQRVGAPKAKAKAKPHAAPAKGKAEAEAEGQGEEETAAVSAKPPAKKKAQGQALGKYTLRQNCVVRDGFAMTSKVRAQAISARCL